MAQRFGGKFSPDATPVSDPSVPAPKFRNRRAQNVSISARALFFAPLPLLFAGIGEIRQGDPIGTVVELGSFAILMLAAWLLAEGRKAESAYNSRKIARPPLFPRKAFAAVLSGVGVLGATWLAAGSGLFTGITFGLLATTAHFFAFGFDPMRRKGMQGVNEFDNDRVARAVEKAEAMVAEIMTAARRIGDRTLEARIEKLCDSAREVFRTVEEDPRDLPRARKFLSVYLMGARDATIKFADFYVRSHDAKARSDYEALLNDLETSFSAHRKELLLENRSDLDVEIEVLRERLKQEGLTA